MTIADIRERGLIIQECISGSKAYGLDTINSDTDIKGVFILPKSDFYSLNYIPQISNESNDIVFYELGKYIELLLVNNPNILELLKTPKDSVIFKHEYLDSLTSEAIISKLCRNTFGKFAYSQIKKATGLNKKILNPMPEKRKSIFSFCYVNYMQGSLPLKEYLFQNKWKQEHCGLVQIPHMKNVYGLYYSELHHYKGILSYEDSNELVMTAIPENEIQKTILYFNRDGYSTYCKEHREYWDWVEKRNESRYENTISHGKNYDSKNMMHVIRLLEMALEIGQTGKINVRRPNREFLMDIKAGKYEYDTLMEIAEGLQEKVNLAFDQSTLQETPDVKAIQLLSYQIREKFYKDMFS